MQSAIPSNGAETSPRGSTWLNWIYGMVFSQAKEVQREDKLPRDPLLVSSIFENWQVVESPEDKLNTLKAKLERQERVQEVQQFRGKRTFSRSLEFFASVISVFSKDESHLLTHKIDPNSRAYIMSKIVSSFQTAWQRTLKSLNFSCNPAPSPDALASWKVFEDSFAETRYSKNILGSMKDISTFILHGASANGLTAKIIMDIATRWTEILNRAMRELLERDLMSDEYETIEKMICDSLCGTIVRMYIDVAKKSGDALKREGRLPQLWQEEDAEKQAKLKTIKQLGTADARYSEPSRPIPIPSSAAPSRQAAVDMLERMLQFRAK